MSPQGEPSKSLVLISSPERFLSLPHLSKVGAVPVVAGMEDFLHQEHQEGSLALVLSQSVVARLESSGVYS